jgi:hypothetical protein
MNKVIKDTKWGIACRIGNNIYINEKIDKTSELYQALIRHEEKHTNSYKIKDILLDLNGKELKKVKKEYYKFMIKNPSSLAIFMPIWKYDNYWALDITMIIFWIFIILNIVIVKIIL